MPPSTRASRRPTRTPARRPRRSSSTSSATRQRHGRPHAAWCANEKTAYEEALGVSFAGRRAMISMKHVGLNVAADPFMNSAIVGDQRRPRRRRRRRPGDAQLAERAGPPLLRRLRAHPCLEPANQQEAYDMTREAFDLSERFRVPGAGAAGHAAGAQPGGRARCSAPRPENPVAKATEPARWILLPSNARRQWRDLLDRQPQFAEWSEASPFNHADAERRPRGPGRHHDRHRAQLLPRERRGPGRRAFAPAHRRLPDPVRRWSAARRPRQPGARARGGLPLRRAPAAGHRAARRSRSSARSPATFRPTAS